MMKQGGKWCVAIFSIWLFSAAPTIRASELIRSAGIGLRSSYWAMPGVQNRVVAHSCHGEDWVDIGGAGGHLYLLSRASERLILELNFGSVGSVRGVNRWYNDDDFDFSAIIPMTIGIRFVLLPLASASVARPYLAAGTGPYIIARASVHESWGESKVTTEWDGHPGAYLGAGLDYQLASWLALNFDARHHFVRFDVDDDYSNFEYGIGLQFMWGRFKR